MFSFTASGEEEAER